MPEDEYRRIACATHAELQDYLQPMSVYVDEYAAVANGAAARPDSV
jgi:hypothetical protein